MRRMGASFLGALVVVLAMFWPALNFFSTTDETPEFARITDYRATFDVGADGTLLAHETLTVDLPLGRHGIFRFFDIADPNSPHVRYVPKDIVVTRDGGSEGVTILHQGEGRFVVARIGEADTTISGTHVYDITYRVDGVLTDSGSDSQFYWNLIPSGWRMPITRSNLTATLPGTPGETKCAIGVNSTGGCNATVDGRTVTVKTGALDPNTPVTIQTQVDVPSPGQHTLPWTFRFDPVFGRSLPAAIVFAVLALLAAVAGFLLGRSVREPIPPYPLMYAPPEGMGPAQGAYLLTERINDEMYAATLLQMGDRGMATIERTPSGWSLIGANGDGRPVDEVTASSADQLGVRPGQRFDADRDAVEIGKQMQVARKSFDSDVKEWARHNGLLEFKAMPVLGSVGVIGGLLVAAACFFWNPLSMSLIGLPFGLFAVFALPVLAPGASTIRTPKGREAWSRLGGFRRVLSTPSSEARFDFSGRKELYTAYIPWAVAFGCAREWAEKYRVEAQEEPPLPAYYIGGYPGMYGGGGSMADFANDFNTTMHSAISSYQATQTSSSGGGGGGFSGGGGGGGGGGGSW